jgi:hypothetical protein
MPATWMNFGRWLPRMLIIEPKKGILNVVLSWKIGLKPSVKLANSVAIGGGKLLNDVDKDVNVQVILFTLLINYMPELVIFSWLAS